VSGRAAKLLRRYVAVCQPEYGTLRQHKRFWRALPHYMKGRARRVLTRLIKQAQEKE
jgi:hypothetical protein